MGNPKYWALMGQSRKGIRLTVLNSGRAESGNTKKANFTLGRSKKSSLFFLTGGAALESVYTAIGSSLRKGSSLSEGFRARSVVLETLAYVFATP